MARTNLSVLPDVSGCLRDAMDHLFNNGNQNQLNQNVNTTASSDDNDAIIDVVNDDDDDQSLTDALQSSINKRKLTNTTSMNSEDKHSNEGTKRLCTMSEQR